MNSCLYKATVMHHRLAPKKHRFHYSVFMFYIDLDELELLKKKLFLLSHNRFNMFSFRDKEHLQLPIDAPDTGKSTKAHLLDYLKQNGMNEAVGKIMCLTNLNILGYNFNPVSFYYVFDTKQQPLCSVAEVSNTFREMKPYFLGKENLDQNTFHLNTTKYFYVSPFFDHDANFDFSLVVPDDKLHVRIDTFNKDERVFISTLSDTKKTLSNGRLFWYSIRFPFLTLRIMALIHWNALLIWLKKIPYHKKNDLLNLQKGVYRKYNKK
jgi:DUF1365 family protein